MLLKFSNIIGRFSLGLKKLISSKFLIHRLNIACIFFFDAFFIFFDRHNMKNILLLGATGSIGDSVLSVIEQNNEKEIFQQKLKLNPIKNKLYKLKICVVFLNPAQLQKYFEHLLLKLNLSQ